MVNLHKCQFKVSASGRQTESGRGLMGQNPEITAIGDSMPAEVGMGTGHSVFRRPRSDNATLHCIDIHLSRSFSCLLSTPTYSRPESCLRSQAILFHLLQSLPRLQALVVSVDTIQYLLHPVRPDRRRKLPFRSWKTHRPSRYGTTMSQLTRTGWEVSVLLARSLHYTDRPRCPLDTIEVSTSRISASFGCCESLI